MGRVRMEWHGDKVERDVLRGVAKNLDQSAMFWVRFARRRLSRAQVSRPGEYLGKDTGHLRRNVTWERFKDLVRRVGTNVIYGKVWETKEDGTARPWMSKTNDLTRDKIAKIIGKKL